MKEYSIEGVIQIPENVLEEVLVRKFLDFIESNDYRFSGVIIEYKEENKNEEK